MTLRQFVVGLVCDLYDCTESDVFTQHTAKYHAIYSYIRRRLYDGKLELVER